MKRFRSGLAKHFLTILPLLVIAVDLLLHNFLPDNEINVNSNCYSWVLAAAAVIYLVFLILPPLRRRTIEKTRYYAPLIAAVFALFGVWDMVTLKGHLLPLPFFPGPEKTIYTFVEDWRLLGTSALYSLRLVVLGYVTGVAAGLITGVALGWSLKASYWISPLLKLVGPVPATALIPLAVVISHNLFGTSVFVVALSVWFPVTVFSSSGIINVNKAYYEVAKTLGADRRYMIFKVAIPAAGPMIFMSLYAGIGSAFMSLLGAEMMGAKAGLGWYINWRLGWAEYGKVYACIFLLGILVLAFIYLILKIKDRLLIWQKGLIKW